MSILLPQYLRPKRLELCIEKTKIALIILLYWIVSIAMVFLNKKCLNLLDAPFFITWFQCLMTSMVLILIRLVSERFRSNSDPFQSANEVQTFLRKNFMLPTIKLDWMILKKILPLSIMFVSMISFNNLSLRVDQEQTIGDLTKLGVMCGILASMFVSLNSIFVAKVLPIIKHNVLHLTYYNSLIALILFLPLIVGSNELSMFKSNDETEMIGINQTSSSVTIETMSRRFDMNFWLLMILTGIFGLLISVVTNLQIKYTSPLTHNISGTAKSCVQTVLATYVFNEHKTVNWWISNIIVLLSSAMYIYVRQQEMNKQFDLKDSIKTIVYNRNEIDENLNEKESKHLIKRKYHHLNQNDLCKTSNRLIADCSSEEQSIIAQIVDENDESSRNDNDQNHYHQIKKNKKSSLEEIKVIP
ncbi:GDP-fucose transporter 1 [Sarcoptes scabiei]|uniref:GDP-fucose transporter 1 n=1 Tax=Sarcoptes scabiei TaxID=52283 RepID=A0A834RFQ1_SARSC|nr:GDP-fucose transporter 1 [Sarcoptes scabiei]